MRWRMSSGLRDRRSRSACAAMKRSGRTRTPRTSCFLAHAMKPESSHCSGKGLRALRGPAPFRANEARVQGVEDREVALRQHGDGIGLESEREPLVAGEELVELGFPLRRSRLSAEAPSGRSARRLPLAAKALRWMAGGGMIAAAADEGAEAAREIETGEERVARGARRTCSSA